MAINNNVQAAGCGQRCTNESSLNFYGQLPLVSEAASCSARFRTSLKGGRKCFPANFTNFLEQYRTPAIKCFCYMFQY